jgi:solute carrier family 36 (proton-coupled amino acid transporter)
MMVTLGVLLGYAIMFFVAIQIMFATMSESYEFAANHPVFSELALRTVMVLVTYTVAMVVPDLTLLLSLVGSVCCTVLAFVLPSMCELILAHDSANGISSWCWAKNSVILLISLFGFFLGGGLSIKEIIESFF